MEHSLNKDCVDEINNEGGKVDNNNEILLPGFRFHPTDEELVGFYLKRKIQQRPLSIELIKQLDIYKFDPWDLPKFSSTGEKECYFYCPRDRKYRNSARPNRVTGAGFWKATGTDRPIYSSEGNKCIGLKKSLVFYKGRAAKGIKTDWMMHEFRLPSLADSTLAKTSIDNNVPANDSWAICRIFKKTSPISSRTTHFHTWASNPSAHTLPSHFRNHSNFIYKNAIEATYNSPIQPMMSSSNISEFDKVLHTPNNNTISILNQIPTFSIDPTTSINNNAHNTTCNNNNMFPNIIAPLLEFPPSYILPTLEDPSEEPESNNQNFSSVLRNMSSSVLRKFDKHTPEDQINADFGISSTINGGCDNDFSPVLLSQDHMQHVNFVDDQNQDFASTLLGNMSNWLHDDEDDGHQWNEIQAIGSIPISGLLWSI